MGCKKEGPKEVSKDYSGSYSFTTIITQNMGYPDTTILYDGSIMYDDLTKILKIDFNPRFSPIFPMVDNKGILTYPELVNSQLGWFFSGNTDDYGNINFILQQTISHHGVDYITSYIVKGKKKQE